MRSEVKLPEEIEKVRQYYNLIESRELSGDPDATQNRVNIIRWMEKETASSFADTKAFRDRMTAFFISGRPGRVGL